MSTLVVRDKLTRVSIVHKLQVAMELAQGWVDRHQQRKLLAVMDDDQLQDLGLSRAEADAEASLPFWK